MATQKIISVPIGHSAKNTPTRDFQDNICPIAIPNDNICPEYGYSSVILISYLPSYIIMSVPNMAT